jgi:hypothetical protein
MHGKKSPLQPKGVKAALAEAARSIIKVGDGRGFVFAHRSPRGEFRLVITAAHCLPHLPPAHPMSYDHERTYENLLSRLSNKPRVWAECVFADPVNDIAVLGPPDNQKLEDEADAFEQLVDGCTALRITDPPVGESGAWAMALDGKWQHRTINCIGGRLWEDNPKVASGMSGSPIVDGTGVAIGLCSTGGSETDLTGSLPGRYYPRRSFDRQVKTYWAEELRKGKEAGRLAWERLKKPSRRQVS